MSGGAPSSQERRKEEALSVRLTKIKADGSINYYLNGVAKDLDTHGRMDYYTAHGNPPGIWLGRACQDLGVVAGSRADRQQVERLFNNLKHPVTGVELKNDGVSKRGHTRGPNGVGAVSGFDLTFENSKSISLLWALGDEDIRRTVQQCHDEAVEETMEWWQDDIAATRIGKGGALQVEVKGVAANKYDHYDTRDHEPHLHSHVVVSNIAVRLDGQTGALDGRTIYAAQVYTSEKFNNIMRDKLRERLGVEFEQREGVQVSGKAVVLDIAGMPAPLIENFSTRSRETNRIYNELVERERELTGHEPSWKTKSNLKEKAFVQARKPKDQRIRSLQELREEWAATARQLGYDMPSIISQCVGRDVKPLDGERLAEQPDIVRDLAELARTDPTQWDKRLAGKNRNIVDRISGEVSSQATTVTRYTVGAAVHRLTATIPMATGTREQLVQAVTSRILDGLESVTPHRYILPDTAIHDPLLAVDGQASADTPRLDRYATPRLLDAEKHLMDAADENTVTPPDPADVDRLLDRYAARFRQEKGYAMAADQLAAARAMLATGKRIGAVTGPAGTGKTTTCRAIKTVYEQMRGQGSVIGMATSAVAAQELSDSLGVPANTVAKIITDQLTGKNHTRANTIKELTELVDNGKASSSQRALLAKLVIEQRSSVIPENGVVIIDEASMTSTMDLARIERICEDRHARIILVGDHQQLAAPGEGGGFLGWMDRSGHAQRLDSVWRFDDPDETRATITLREGKLDATGTPAALDMYANLGERPANTGKDHPITPARHTANDAGRIHGASDGTMEDTAYQRTLDALDERRSALLIVATNDSLREINERISLALQAKGVVDATPSHHAPLSDGLSCAQGSIIVTRKNDRTIVATDGVHVMNGTLWTVTATGPAGVTAVRNDGSGATIKLSREYLRESAELGYAVTAHRSQGMTVDEANLWVPQGASINKELLYVAMTRGRRANDMWIDTATMQQLQDSNEYRAWADRKRVQFEAQGLRLWTGEGPAPQGWFTMKDCEPTDIEQAKDIAKTMMLNEQQPLTATEQRERHIKTTRSLDHLIADRSAFTRIAVEPRLTSELNAQAGRDTTQAMTDTDHWDRLIHTYAQAQAIDPAGTKRIIEQSVHEANQGTQTRDDGMLFDQPDPTLLTRTIRDRLDTMIVTPNLGNHPDWQGGICAPIEPRADDMEQARAATELLRQNARMIDEKTRDIVDNAIEGKAPWAMKLPEKPSGKEPERLARWGTLTRDIAVYRRQWDIDADNPLGPKPDQGEPPAKLVQWRNLADRWVEYRDGLEPGTAARQREQAMRMRDAGITAPEPQEATSAYNQTIGETTRPRTRATDPTRINAIATVNERVWQHWKQLTADSWTPEYMRRAGLDPAIAAYAPAGGESTMHWAIGNGIGIRELDEAGLTRQGEHGLEDRFNDRLILPIRDDHDRIIAFTGLRNPDKPAMKEYETSAANPAYDPAYDLYGIDGTTVRTLRDGGRIILCDKPMDAEALRHAARQAAAHTRETYVPIAANGTTLTRERLAELRWKTGSLGMSGTLEAPILLQREDVDRRAQTMDTWRMLTPREKMTAAVIHTPTDTPSPFETLTVHGERELALDIRSTRPLWQNVIDLDARHTDLRLVETQREWVARERRAVIDELPPEARPTAYDYLQNVLDGKARLDGAVQTIDIRARREPEWQDDYYTPQYDSNKVHESILQQEAARADVGYSGPSLY